MFGILVLKLCDCRKLFWKGLNLEKRERPKSIGSGLLVVVSMVPCF